MSMQHHDIQEGLPDGIRIPRTGGAGAMMGHAAVLIWNDVTDEGRTAFYDWHDGQHIPERLDIPGFLRGRRYLCPGHSPEWLTFYEAEDLSVLTSPSYLDRLNDPTPETTRTLTHFRNTSRAVCSIADSLGTSSGGHALTMRLDVASDSGEAMRAHLREKVMPRAMDEVGIVACHLFAADHSASFIDTAESSTRTFDVPSWVLVVEGTRRDALDRLRAAIPDARMQALRVAVRADAAVYSLEISRLAPTLFDPHRTKT